MDILYLAYEFAACHRLPVDYRRLMVVGREEQIKCFRPCLVIGHIIGIEMSHILLGIIFMLHSNVLGIAHLFISAKSVLEVNPVVMLLNVDLL